MGRIASQGRQVSLSYSTNVHPAETVEDLHAILEKHVAPVSRGAFGEGEACVNLRLGMKQANALVAHGALPSTSTLSDAVLAAPPSPECAQLLEKLKALRLRVISINAFPIRDFHAPRVKEQVYSPPWTDGGRSLFSLKIAKVFSHMLGDAKEGAISVPSGTFKGYVDSEEVRAQCAHFLTECARELLRLERLTGKTVRLGLEPEPFTTGEALDEFLGYYKQILADARAKYPSQLGINGNQAEDIARKFITINLDLCHQAVEFEDPLEDLRKLKAAGIAVTGLHLSAALQLPEPAKNATAFKQLQALDEPRYLHQIVAKLRDGTLVRFEDLPDLGNPRRMGARTLNDFAEVRCHFHVPLFADWPGALSSTRDTVGPAARFAAKEGLTDHFVVETYTWGVLNALAGQGNTSAQAIAGPKGVDVNAGLVKEIQWAQAELQKNA